MKCSPWKKWLRTIRWVGGSKGNDGEKSEGVQETQVEEPLEAASRIERGVNWSYFLSDKDAHTTLSLD